VDNTVTAVVAREAGAKLKSAGGAPVRF